MTTSIIGWLNDYFHYWMAQWLLPLLDGSMTTSISRWWDIQYLQFITETCSCVYCSCLQCMRMVILQVVCDGSAFTGLPGSPWCTVCSTRWDAVRRGNHWTRWTSWGHHSYRLQVHVRLIALGQYRQNVYKGLMMISKWNHHYNFLPLPEQNKYLYFLMSCDTKMLCHTWLRSANLTWVFLLWNTLHLSRKKSILILSMLQFIIWFSFRLAVTLIIWQFKVINV